MSLDSDTRPQTSTAGREGAASSERRAPRAWVQWLRDHRRRWWLIAAVVLLVVLTAGWVLWASPLLKVDQVTVTGIDEQQVPAVLEAAAVPTGTPLLRLDTEAVSERVGQLPAVGTVTVRRDWPDAVVLEVTPARWVAYTSDGQGRFLVWTEDGTKSLPVEGEQAPAGMPELTVDEQGWEQALSIASALEGPVAAQVERIDQDGDEFYLTLRDRSATVRWGSAEQSALKAKMLEAMVRTDQTATWFDVSAPLAPRSAAARPQRAQPSPSAATTAGTDAATPAAQTATSPTTATGLDEADGAVDNSSVESPAAVPSGEGEQSRGLQPIP